MSKSGWGKDCPVQLYEQRDFYNISFWLLCMYSSMFGRKLRHVQNKVVRQDRSRMSRSDVCTLRTVAAVQYNMVVNGKNVVRYCNGKRKRKEKKETEHVCSRIANGMDTTEWRNGATSSKDAKPCILHNKKYHKYPQQQHQHQQHHITTFSTINIP